METIYTYWFIGVLLGFPTSIYLIMVLKRDRIKEMEEMQEDAYENNIYDQIIESGQNTFM